MSVIRAVDIVVWPERLKLLFNQADMALDELNVAGLYPFANPDQCIIRFRGLPLELKETGKIYARIELFIGRAPSTVQGHIGILSRFFGEAKGRGIQDYRMLRLEDAQTILNDGQYSAGTCSKICFVLKSLYVLMGAFGHQSLIQMNIPGLEDLRRRYATLEAQIANAHKTPDIDEKYFSIMAQELPLLVWNEDLDINYRVIAAVLWLDVYIGLRPSDLLTLKVNSHVSKKTLNNKLADYLYYDVPKLEKGGSIKRQAECYMLPGAVTAFSALLELRKSVPGFEKTDALIILEGEEHINTSRLRYYRDNLFKYHLNSLCTKKWDNVAKRSIKGKTMYIPSFTQFRVHLCSYLYGLGMRLHIIELGMSHLTQAMIAYYDRIKDRTFSDQLNRVDNVIRTRINNDFDLEEHLEKGESLIQNFILAYSRFRVCARKIDIMKNKGYDYEVDRYVKHCQSIISTELRPALSYLDVLVKREGKEKVLIIHPNLAKTINNMNGLIVELRLWEEKQKTY